uniref:Uncharacterized protein n=1 Tax=Candidatus Kentrum sp. DK TaxID=2126562 RepID=A0A450SG59_9GAMM|nr:MAG: hypothetical protein BECKDK2373C_GA0170839_103328 [Candidatus Kentron sp. DK]
MKFSYGIAGHVASLEEALSQRNGYRADLKTAYGEKLRQHTRAVVGMGFERLVWE